MSLQTQSGYFSSCSRRKQAGGKVFACELSFTALDLLWLTPLCKSRVWGMLWTVEAEMLSPFTACIIWTLLYHPCVTPPLISMVPLKFEVASHRLQIEVICKVREVRVWNVYRAYHWLTTLSRGEGPMNRGQTCAPIPVPQLKAVFHGT